MRHVKHILESMSWTQVYVTGLSRSVEPSDEDIEKRLVDRYSLAAGVDSDGIMWAGEGSTLVKRDEMGACRGFAFLAFYSAEGASIVVDRMNTYPGNESAQQGEEEDGGGHGDGSCIPLLLHAELSNPKAGKAKSKKKIETQDYSDLRLRKQRKAPVRKHPVITSSDGKRTNLGNKTK